MFTSSYGTRGVEQTLQAQRRTCRTGIAHHEAKMRFRSSPGSVNRVGLITRNGSSIQRNKPKKNEGRCRG